MSVTADQARRYAVGSLVRARGREWVVLPESYSDADPDLLVLRPLGATDAETAGILPDLEEVVPATFAPPDPTQPGDARSAALLRDALRLGFRSSAGPFRSFGQISVDPRPYQLVPLLMALKQHTVRLLIADDVGIGKTIEAGLIAGELLAQGAAQRLAVLSPPHLAEQWQAELATKFHIQAEPVLASTARRLERGLGIGESLFERHDNVIVSTDFIKAERHREDFIRVCPDLVIVDEAHGFALGNDRGRQLRNELLRKLSADPNRHIILVTATPHSGNEQAFRSLLALLDPALKDLPDDMSGEHNRRHRERLARHLVQRRRADIETYLGADTPFPTREQADFTYKLTAEYRRLFDKAVNFARESYHQAEGDARRQRVHWWSALALLRSLGSSPAAAVATLHARAANAEARTVAEADELGRRAVLDQAGDEDAESLDVIPGTRYENSEEDSSGAEQVRSDTWFRELARDAAALSGSNDPKLQAAVKLVDELLAAGHNPILFCRFIPTAEYVAEHVREHLSKRRTDPVEVDAVTGTLAPAEREERVAELAAFDRRVLVATDCLSEGINLQEDFDAVVHYDLSWNPTRHEQREGRVDRFGQPEPTVRTVTFFGENSPIDGIVLEVLLRKHQRIRKALGVAVPVPTDSAAVIDAILEGLITRGRSRESAFDQLSLDIDDGARAADNRLDVEWQAAAERERKTRTLYAQYTIQPDEVRRELIASREATGAGMEAKEFLATALEAYGATVTETRRGRLTANMVETPLALREAIGLPAGKDALEILRDGQLTLERTNPILQAVAAHTLDQALDGGGTHPIASRCAAIRTRAVQRRTSLLLTRMRFHLTLTQGNRPERSLLAEDAQILAFAGQTEDPEWRDGNAEQLLAAAPDENIAHEQAVTFITRLVEGLPGLMPELDRIAGERATALAAAHARVRESASARGRVTVNPQLPVDILGAYVLLPAGNV
ncbi:MAG: helicase-related protein [Solirubrobacteraceae bacterium]